MHSLTLFVTTLLLHTTHASLPDGLIVPFFSKLPACASLCGKLSDVQGGCVPPVVSAVSQQCFCTDARLTSFLQGPAAVAEVCSSTSGCTASQFQAIEDWYSGYCGHAEQKGNAVATTTAASTTSATATAAKSTKNTGGSWVSTHWRWLIMFIAVFGGLATVALGCWFWRRSYLRKREAKRLMRMPVTILNPSDSYPGARDFASEKVGSNVSIRHFTTH